MNIITEVYTKKRQKTSEKVIDSIMKVKVNLLEKIGKQNINQIEFDDV